MSRQVGIGANLDVQVPGFHLRGRLALPGYGAVAIMGARHSGKTLLMRIIAGLERHPGVVLSVNGEVWESRDIYRHPHERAACLLHPHSPLFPHLSVESNIRFGSRGLSRGRALLGFERAIDLTDCAHLRKRWPQQLDAVDRVRILLARALACDPGVLLLDDLLAGLDDRHQREMLRCLLRIRAECRVPMLFTTPSLEMVDWLADWGAVLEDGQVKASCPAADLMTRSGSSLALDDAAAMMISGEVVRIDAAYGLMHLSFVGGVLLAPYNGAALNTRTRVRVRARDVVLSATPHADTSVLGSLLCQVQKMRDVAPAQTLVQLKAGEAQLLARITRRSRHNLGLEVGHTVYAMIKTSAIGH